MKQQTIKSTDAFRLQRRKNDAIDRRLRRHRTAKARPLSKSKDRLRVTPLGGQSGIGEKNMIVLEYGDDAIVLDCGFELGIDLPGINYAIPVTDYLQTIRHKLKGYVISHGHMDHIGGLIHIVPDCPAPIFGSRFTIGMVQAQFDKADESGLEFTPDTRILDMDTHERVQLGGLTIELVRVTHAIPESSAIIVDTPVGRVINTGDFRLDPEPLDKLPSDIARLKQLGDEGVLLLMSESTNTTKLGRTPTEHTLQKSFHDLMSGAEGRVFVAIFSTNMNRVQMIIDAAVTHGRKVVLDGRSMIATAELAVRLGTLKIPKGTLVAMREVANISDSQLVVICTGGQGEPGASLSRMAIGEHQHITLKNTDSVIVSSTPIPGNERSYQQIRNDLAGIGVKQYHHPTHEIDGAGPLHVSGHANRDEHAEMIALTRPRYLLPIYGGRLNREYHRRIAIDAGMQPAHVLMADNGEVVELGSVSPRIVGTVTSGALLVDQTGNVVPEIVTRDRLLLQDGGFIVVVVTIDRRTGHMITSPDILTRGYTAVRDNAALIDALRGELRKLKIQPNADRNTVELLKHRLKDLTGDYIYRHTKGAPIIIPVVNLVGYGGKTNRLPKPIAD